MKLVIILPAFNEEKTIGGVIKGVKKEIQRFKNAEVVVVDDGSTDRTGEIAQNLGVTLLRHVLNRGLGGALGTGLAFAKLKAADLVVTLDSDGQHDPKDIKKIIKPIVKNKADVVIGSRLLSDSSLMPLERKIVNWIGNIITFFLFGIWTTDSQSGFRAFSKKALRKIRLKTDRMEVSSEIFAEIARHKLRLAEVPIRVVYTPYSKAKGQSSLNAFKIFYKLILRLVR